jgi:hypothetical protein
MNLKEIAHFYDNRLRALDKLAEASLQGNDLEQMREKYEEDFGFTDEEVALATAAKKEKLYNQMLSCAKSGRLWLKQELRTIEHYKLDCSDISRYLEEHYSAEERIKTRKIMLRNLASREMLQESWQEQHADALEATGITVEEVQVFAQKLVDSGYRRDKIIQYMIQKALSNPEWRTEVAPTLKLNKIDISEVEQALLDHINKTRVHMESALTGIGSCPQTDRQQYLAKLYDIDVNNIREQRGPTQESVDANFERYVVSAMAALSSDEVMTSQGADFKKKVFAESRGRLRSGFYRTEFLHALADRFRKGGTVTPDFDDYMLSNDIVLEDVYRLAREQAIEKIIKYKEGTPSMVPKEIQLWNSRISHLGVPYFRKYKLSARDIDEAFQMQRKRLLLRDICMRSKAGVNCMLVYAVPMNKVGLTAIEVRDQLENVSTFKRSEIEELFRDLPNAAARIKTAKTWEKHTNNGNLPDEVEQVKCKFNRLWTDKHDELGEVTFHLKFETGPEFKLVSIEDADLLDQKPSKETEDLLRAHLLAIIKDLGSDVNLTRSISTTFTLGGTQPIL